jgi:hypothetical protein
MDLEIYLFIIKLIIFSIDKLFANHSFIHLFIHSIFIFIYFADSICSSTLSDFFYD